MSREMGAEEMVPGFRPAPVAIENPMPLLPDQEIRARALECACRLYTRSYDDIMAEGRFTEFWNRLREFEAYIRDGR